MCLGMGFTAFKFSLKKIEGKDRKESKMRLLSQGLQLGKKKTSQI